ncbi:MAG: energy transducer TonB [Erythrobacter sp.]
MAAILVFHVAAFYVLALALAPDLTRSVTQEVGKVFMVTVTTPPEEPPLPEVEPEPDEGAQGDPGKRAEAKPVEAPKPKIEIPNPSPRPTKAAEGNDNSSGSQEQGTGPGSAGSGDGSGSGNGGNGQGNTPRVAATKPNVLSGNLNTASDFPVPEGGRATRFGKSVTVVFTVTTDGRAKNCSVASSSVDAQTAGGVCGLVIQKIRFNPAKDQFGDPIEARFGYRVDFRAR